MNLGFLVITGKIDRATNIFAVTSTATVNPPKFMGIDLSLTSTGVSFLGDTFAIQSKLRGTERLVEISERLVNFAQDVQPVAIVMEGYSFGSKFSRAHSIGELGGAVKVGLHKAGFRMVEVPPKCRAKFATGNGNAGKDEVLAAVKEIVPEKFVESFGDDECDAWVLEHMAYAQIGESPYKWSDQQMSALEKVDWTPLYEALRRNARWSELLP